MRRLTLSALAFLALLWPGSGLLHAGKTLKPVKACSAYGNGCLVAPVREMPLGLQAQLKSGTWIYCRGDCRETIRQDVLDFWETQQEKAQIVR